MDALTAIYTKRDTRSFTSDPVDDETLRKILQAGRMAGSAKNLQPCRFVVLTDRAHKEELAACGQFSAWIPEAAINLAIVVPADGREFDAGRAAQNVMIAAKALGLASCPVTMHDADGARLVLGLPDDWKVSIVIALGRAPEGGAAGMGAPRLPMNEMAHRERWGTPYE